MSCGRLFQSRLPAAVKARSPTVTSLVVGIMTSSECNSKPYPRISNGSSFNDLEWLWVTWRNIQWHKASRGLSATAELLVRQMAVQMWRAKWITRRTRRPPTAIRRRRRTDASTARRRRRRAAHLQPISVAAVSSPPPAARQHRGECDVIASYNAFALFTTFARPQLHGQALLISFTHRHASRGR